MQGFLLLSCFVLVATDSVLSSAHMIPEEKLSNNRVVALSQNLAVIPPPVVIVGKNQGPTKDVCFVFGFFFSQKTKQNTKQGESFNEVMLLILLDQNTLLY